MIIGTIAKNRCLITFALALLACGLAVGIGYAIFKSVESFLSSLNPLNLITGLVGGKGNVVDDIGKLVKRSIQDIQENKTNFSTSFEIRRYSIEYSLLIVAEVTPVWAGAALELGLSEIGVNNVGIIICTGLMMIASSLNVANEVLVILTANLSALAVFCIGKLLLALRQYFTAGRYNIESVKEQKILSAKNSIEGAILITIICGGCIGFQIIGEGVAHVQILGGQPIMFSSIMALITFVRFSMFSDSWLKVIFGLGVQTVSAWGIRNAGYESELCTLTTIFGLSMMEIFGLLVVLHDKSQRYSHLVEEEEKLEQERGGLKKASKFSHFFKTVGAKLISNTLECSDSEQEMSLTEYENNRPKRKTHTIVSLSDDDDEVDKELREQISKVRRRKWVLKFDMRRLVKVMFIAILTITSAMIPKISGADDFIKPDKEIPDFCKTKTLIDARTGEIFTNEDYSKKASSFTWSMRATLTAFEGKDEPLCFIFNRFTSHGEVYPCVRECGSANNIEFKNYTFAGANASSNPAGAFEYHGSGHLKYGPMATVITTKSSKIKKSANLRYSLIKDNMYQKVFIGYYGNVGQFELCTARSFSVYWTPAEDKYDYQFMVLFLINPTIAFDRFVGKCTVHDDQKCEGMKPIVCNLFVSPYATGPSNFLSILSPFNQKDTLTNHIKETITKSTYFGHFLSDTKLNNVQIKYAESLLQTIATVNKVRIIDERTLRKEYVSTEIMHDVIVLPCGFLMIDDVFVMDPTKNNTEFFFDSNIIKIGNKSISCKKEYMPPIMTALQMSVSQADIEEIRARTRRSTDSDSTAKRINEDLPGLYGTTMDCSVIDAFNWLADFRPQWWFAADSVNDEITKNNNANLEKASILKSYMGECGFTRDGYVEKGSSEIKINVPGHVVVTHNCGLLNYKAALHGCSFGGSKGKKVELPPTHCILDKNDDNPLGQIHGDAFKNKQTVKEWYEKDRQKEAATGGDRSVHMSQYFSSIDKAHGKKPAGSVFGCVDSIPTVMCPNGDLRALTHNPSTSKLGSSRAKIAAANGKYGQIKRWCIYDVTVSKRFGMPPINAFYECCQIDEKVKDNYCLQMRSDDSYSLSLCGVKLWKKVDNIDKSFLHITDKITASVNDLYSTQGDLKADLDELSKLAELNRNATDDVYAKLGDVGTKMTQLVDRIYLQLHKLYVYVDKKTLKSSLLGNANNFGIAGNFLSRLDGVPKKFVRQAVRAQKLQDPSLVFTKDELPNNCVGEVCPSTSVIEVDRSSTMRFTSSFRTGKYNTVEMVISDCVNNQLNYILVSNLTNNTDDWECIDADIDELIGIKGLDKTHLDFKARRNCKNVQLRKADCNRNMQVIKPHVRSKRNIVEEEKRYISFKQENETLRISNEKADFDKNLSDFIEILNRHRRSFFNSSEHVLKSVKNITKHLDAVFAQRLQDWLVKVAEIKGEENNIKGNLTFLEHLIFNVMKNNNNTHILGRLEFEKYVNKSAEERDGKIKKARDEAVSIAKKDFENAKNWFNKHLPKTNPDHGFGIAIAALVVTCICLIWCIVATLYILHLKKLIEWNTLKTKMNEAKINASIGKAGHGKTANMIKERMVVLKLNGREIPIRITGQDDFKIALKPLIGEEMIYAGRLVGEDCFITMGDQNVKKAFIPSNVTARFLMFAEAVQHLNGNHPTANIEFIGTSEKISITITVSGKKLQIADYLMRLNPEETWTSDYLKSIK